MSFLIAREYAEGRVAGRQLVRAGAFDRDFLDQLARGAKKHKNEIPRGTRAYLIGFIRGGRSAI